MSLLSKCSEQANQYPAQPSAIHAVHEAGETSWTRSINLANISLVVALCVSIGSWLSTIRSPLWLDETISYWQISGGFRPIWARQGLSFPAYSYILWAAKSLLGSSEVALRLPSVFAMFAAAYVLYRIAREFFAFDVAVIVVVIFCLHPIISFAAVDARPYAFGALIVNCTILSFLRWMKTDSTLYAILFGSSAGAIFYFHYLFGVILLAFAILLLAQKGPQWRPLAPKLRLVVLPFLVVLLPTFSRLFYLFHTSGSHTFDGPPRVADLLYTVAPGVIARLFAGAAFVTALLGTARRQDNDKEASYTGLTCLLLAAIPLMSLYSVSSLTDLHVFVSRYRLVAVPGIALCWGVLVSYLSPRSVRVGFCVALVALTLNEFGFFAISFDKPHGYTWKYALAVANANSSSDKAPVLLCSDLPESNFESMPLDPRSTGFFAPISYYPVNSRVIPLPRALNEEAQTDIDRFLAAEKPVRRRFLALAYTPSLPTIEWITATTKGTYVAQTLGTYDGVTVMEYTPR